LALLFCRKGFAIDLVRMEVEFELFIEILDEVILFDDLTDERGLSSGLRSVDSEEEIEVEDLKDFGSRFAFDVGAMVFLLLTLSIRFDFSDIDFVDVTAFATAVEVVDVAVLGDTADLSKEEECFNFSDPVDFVTVSLAVEILEDVENENSFTIVKSFGFDLEAASLFSHAA